MNFKNLYSLVVFGKTSAKQTNPGIGIVDIAKEVDKLRHSQSRLGIGIADVAKEVKR